MVKLLKVISSVLILFLGVHAFAVMTSTASFTVTGVVPEVYSLSTQSLSHDLDLKPGLKVTQQPIGKLRFRYNESVEGITIASSTESGNPESESGKTIKFSRPFSIGVLGGCRSLDMKELKEGVTLDSSGEDYKSLAANNLQSIGSGIEEDCQLVASWSAISETHSKNRSRSGVYSMNIIVTMVSL